MSNHFANAERPVFKRLPSPVILTPPLASLVWVCGFYWFCFRTKSILGRLPEGPFVLPPNLRVHFDVLASGLFAVVSVLALWCLYVAYIFVRVRTRPTFLRATLLVAPLIPFLVVTILDPGRLLAWFLD